MNAASYKTGFTDALTCICVPLVSVIPSAVSTTTLELASDRNFCATTAMAMSGGGWGTGLTASFPCMQVKDSKITQEVLGILAENGTVTADVVRTIKQDILGYTTFLVRDVEYLDGLRAGAVELRGNARKDPKEVAAVLTAGLTERCDTVTQASVYDLAQMVL